MNLGAAIIAAAAATFFWRALGAVLAGRVSVESPGFRFASRVAYAMVAALVLKLIVYPQGVAATASLADRGAAIAATLLIFWLSRRNIALSAWGGVAALAAIQWATGG